MILILACLFHDIGHLLQIENDSENMSKYGVRNHEKITKKFLLDNNIPEPIPSLAENHVKAKKYKTFKNPNYFNKLSNASKQTLIFQGGPMTEQEAIEFFSNFVPGLNLAKGPIIQFCSMTTPST